MVIKEQTPRQGTKPASQDPLDPLKQDPRAFLAGTLVLGAGRGEGSMSAHLSGVRKFTPVLKFLYLGNGCLRIKHQCFTRRHCPAPPGTPSPQAGAVQDN